MPIRLLAAAVTAALTPLVAFASAAGAAPIGAYTTKGAWNFVSAPALHPPRLRMIGHTARGSLAPGNFLIDTFPNLAAKGPMTGQGGPLIVDNGLRPVWIQPVGTSQVSGDLQQETFNGEPVLVWWQGVITDTGATTSGEVRIVDQRYRNVATLKAQGPTGCNGAGCWQISIHDAVIDGNDIWVTVYRNVPGQNLSRYGGSQKGTVYDAGVQEYSLANPRRPTLVHTWDALNPGGARNVPLSDSEQPASRSTGAGPGGSWDAYHVNAIEVVSNNQLLVTMRNTWAAYLIDTSTDAVVWRLGGKRSSFSLPANAQFAWPHDARLLPDDQVTLFDDNCCKELPGGKFAKPNGPSRGLVLRLDTATHKASRVAAYTHSPNLFVAFLGSMQLLPNLGAVLGWGSRPFFSEYSRSGRQLLDAAFPGKDQSYRALWTPNWVGTPPYPPSGALRTSGGRTTLYASWNGATQVASWVVFAGSSSQRLSRVASSSRTGFETAISLASKSYNVVDLRAVDGSGRLLGSKVVKGKVGSGLPQSY
jgi:Arylsulfotransferase (ASST)